MYLKINLLEDEDLRRTIKFLVESQLKSLVREEVQKTVNSEITRILNEDNGFTSKLVEDRIREYLSQSYSRIDKYCSNLEHLVRDILGEKIRLAMEDRLMKVLFISPFHDTVIHLFNKDYVGSRGFYQFLLDFKSEVMLPGSSDEAFLGNYGDWEVYFTNKELPSDLKYEGLVEELYPHALDWFNK